MGKLLLFDIDGTLLLTGGCGKIAFDLAFQELFGVKGAWGDLKPDGKTDPAIFDELIEQNLAAPLKPSDYLALTERYLFYFDQEIKKAEGFRLMPGIPHLLNRLVEIQSLNQKLDKENIFLGIATGNLEAAAWQKLERGGLHSHFQFGGFGSDAKDRTELTRIAHDRGKAHAHEPLGSDDVYVIGDTPHDIHAAKACGVRSIVVGTGSYSETELQKCAPTFYVQDLTNVAEFLQMIGL